MSEESFKKGTKILYQREVQKRAWFIIKGSAREFKEDQNNHPQEQTTWFWFDGDLIYTVPGFFSQDPVLSSVELLEDSQLVYLKIEDYVHLKNGTALLFDKIRDHYESLRQQYYISKSHLSGKEKYLQLFKVHPELFNYAKQKDIAYFLGLSPNSLSRLRRTIDRE
ncbi:Crp/Fnr family transcriptional regulator [Pedobacter cryoconitis]|uniref:CRP-like cAMP-binding protein n=1 Tax=Pedobacter cryoconitis TaxID=188932 RepID=A0A7X0J2C3_9SPHI|nr:cyclic nucleotide-binding domain-containing protein [Pedobacter cryoconitis]MBB6499147.1 CRP-like cAMP-binding protein [Pedobacter cryoconitis]